MTASTMNDLRQCVSNVAQQVAALEKEARQILQTNYNEETYRDVMRQKAALLASLSTLATPVTAQLPATETNNRIKERLESFSQSASNALNLNSVFYMSALLFPEDHQEGTPNDLELFIAEYL